MRALRSPATVWWSGVIAVALVAGGADDAIFTAGYHRTFTLLAPASRYAASIIQAVFDLARSRVRTVVFLSADDGFSRTTTRAGEAAARRMGFTVRPTQYFPEGA